MSKITNLGQIIGEMLQNIDRIQDGYEMDCMISSEFTPPPNFDNVWDFNCTKFNVDPIEVGVQFLTRCDLTKNLFWIHTIIPEASVSEYEKITEERLIALGNRNAKYRDLKNWPRPLFGRGF